jgi:hypothetical protein
MTMRFRLDRIQRRPDSEHWNDDDLLGLGEPAALYWAWHVDVTDADLSAEIVVPSRGYLPPIAGRDVGGIGRDHGGQQY